MTMRSALVATFVAIIAAWLILYAAITGWLGLSLKNEVRPLEAITLVVNLLIAFFLQRFIATRINDLRAEKNVLIEESTEIIRLLNEVHELTDAQFNKLLIVVEDKDAIIIGFRRIANAITDLQESIKLSHIGSTAEYFDDIWSDYRYLKAIATGDFFPSKGYSILQRISQEKLFRSLKTRCQRLIFTINNAQK
jgi:hypothetical protein